MPRFSAALGPPGAGPPGSGPPGNGPLSVDQFIALITATQHDVANAKGNPVGVDPGLQGQIEVTLG